MSYCHGCLFLWKLSLGYRSQPEMKLVFKNSLFSVVAAVPEIKMLLMTKFSCVCIVGELY